MASLSIGRRLVFLASARRAQDGGNEEQVRLGREFRMRVVWRRMPAAGFNHELVWLALSIAALAGGFAWAAIGLGWPQCPFLAMTGWPCMTCGVTRTTIAFLQGNFPQAFSWNPLAALALGGVVAFDLYAVVVLLSRAPRLRVVDWARIDRNIVWIAVTCSVLLNWVYLLSQRGYF